MQESLNTIKDDKFAMADFETKIKKIGNELGCIIPKEIVQENKLNVGEQISFTINLTKEQRLKRLFGSLKTDKSTEEILKDDGGWDHDW